MSTYRITTEADTRSKSRRTRTWEIQALSLEEAVYEARRRHIALVGWNASIWVVES
jgi:hypothetical protein